MPKSFGAQKGKSENKNTLMRNCLLFLGFTLAACVLVGGWLFSRGIIIKSSLEEVRSSIPSIKAQLIEGGAVRDEDGIRNLTEAVSKAKNAADDPLWNAASSVPFVGRNFSAVTEGVTSFHDVVTGAAVPLLVDPEITKLGNLIISDGAVNTNLIEAGAPKLRAAANVVKLSHERIVKINTARLLTEVAQPLEEARAELASARQILETAADVSTVVPPMLGSQEPRRYLLLVQNNAESRASGGIPGALAVLSLNEGHFSLSDQISASEFGTLSPSLGVDPAQQAIFSSRLGKFIQDVNLTPDFPTAAETAQEMWERKTGQKVNGVISVDPLALGYILEGTGPVKVTSPELSASEAAGLPTELSAQNIVRTLLSDVYAKIDEPRIQDAYFAGVAQEVFAAVTSGRSDPKKLLSGIARGTSEGRVSVWSAQSGEQSIINKYNVSGAIAGPSIAPAQFGVYFNDGTGAKMDYYVKRTVQIVKRCPKDGYEQTTIRISSTNAAPSDAAKSLPSYVTGGGNFGVPAGSVQTNIVAYGPVQANVEMAMVDGQKTQFAPYVHSSRPVGVVSVRLAPGESRAVEFTFGKIVQHTEPNVVVTPTVQLSKDVLLPVEQATCAREE